MVQLVLSGDRGLKQMSLKDTNSVELPFTNAPFNELTLFCRSKT